MNSKTSTRTAGLWQLTVLGLAVLAACLTHTYWLPTASAWAQQVIHSFRSHTADAAVAGDDASHEDDSHAGHAHAGHSEETSLALSAQALRNVGLSGDMIRPVSLTTFQRTITVPGVVVERPGRTRVEVSTPMTGVVTQVRVVQGEALEPGRVLFTIRLTHEDLVQAQTNFLRTLGELDVEKREIARLSQVTNSGAVAGKVLLERQYARDKLTALLQAQREALRLHGLSAAQVEEIARARRLLRELQIVAPGADGSEPTELRLSLAVSRPRRPVAGDRRSTGTPIDSVRSPTTTRYANRSAPRDNTQEPNAPQHPLILQQLNVHKGQAVMAGDTLCVLADYEELFIEGMAFEQDISQLRQASQNSWPVQAVFPRPGSQNRVVSGLAMAYLSSRVDTQNRTLHFYVHLPNEITKDASGTANRFIEWRYLPGQRLQLRVPVEQWPQQIVLPIEAVAREGAEYFIFQQNGDHFDRVPVHVKYKDQHNVVIENDGQVFPGDVVAMRGAHQLQMALKNKAGGAVDPHAGHNH